MWQARKTRASHFHNWYSCMGTALPNSSRWRTMRWSASSCPAKCEKFARRIDTVCGRSAPLSSNQPTRSSCPAATAANRGVQPCGRAKKFTEAPCDKRSAAVSRSAVVAANIKGDQPLAASPQSTGASNFKRTDRASCQPRCNATSMGDLPCASLAAKALARSPPRRSASANAALTTSQREGFELEYKTSESPGARFAAQGSLRRDAFNTQLFGENNWTRPRLARRSRAASSGARWHESASLAKAKSSNASERWHCDGRRKDACADGAAMGAASEIRRRSWRRQ
mmetsp:Transcript_86921/g.243581  ORF Transcript_86921/g.243581 Transcript_86921/m.243581 type:complete len:284 (+) Transcript_86921:82-933(+)